jgi:hypothetical protein
VFTYEERKNSVETGICTIIFPLDAFSDEKQVLMKCEDDL